MLNNLSAMVIKADLTAINGMLDNTLAETLGIEITECEHGRVVATMPVDSKTHQPLGLLHGGASVSLAETVASVGGLLLVSAEGKVVVGQEINANHIRSIKSGQVVAEGKVVHQGKTSQVWEIKISDTSNRLLCISRCTLAVVQVRHEGS